MATTLSKQPTARSRRGWQATENTNPKVELNSPKLEYAEMEKLQEVIRTLRRAGGKVISSCGIHVHVDASKHTPQSLKNVLSIVFVLINTSNRKRGAVALFLCATAPFVFVIR